MAGFFISSMTPVPSIFLSSPFLFYSRQIHFMLDYGKYKPCKYYLLTPQLHKEIADRTYSISELTTRMELAVVKVKLVSMHRPFSNWAGSLAISNHLPMNCEGRNTHELKDDSEHHQWRVWINLHTLVVSVTSTIKPVFHQSGKVTKHTQVRFYLTNYNIKMLPIP